MKDVTVEQLLAKAEQPSKDAMRLHPFYKGKIDGDIGSLTKKAIREFQAENNLIVDGEVGPKTWVVLKKYLLSQEEIDYSQ